ncbi:extracellular solute-binding protein [Actinomycetospora cinnamomea]|uniref:Iron(III) transport system substrate-binding protein n=1 Tax=Actinomycetospora cinnamomea TaxID=663609 RepID=A0A2U1EWG3_9PSEU|nr:extracellular solute-binding protein [Actinomycetospora cinnamomea]PVZ04251.1 iron(III) transport system substrate-binding protein [Actinomycetospora cinnamomea]
MRDTLLRPRVLVPAVALAAVAVVVVVVAVVGVGGEDPAPATASPTPAGGETPEVVTAGVPFADRLVVYNGRSHYGDEQVFREFEARTGVRIELRGGTAGELGERLAQEGADTPADLLITTDLANLWRAEQQGLLQPVTSETLRTQVPERLHADDGAWWAVSTRLRVPLVATERVRPEAVTGYESLGDPAFAGRTCLRTSNSEYNQSLVADMIAKRGPQATEALLRSWMANDPDILGSDGEMLAAMAAGDCDVGLANHYYLGRALKDDPSFPVAPAWPDQGGAGAHANVSGVGVVRGSDAVPTAVALMEWLTSPPAQEQIVSRSEFAANPQVPPPAHIASWADVRIDPIAVEEAGPLLDEAVAMMLAVGWR